MPGFLVQNFGCRASQADGAAVESQLKAAGLSPASEMNAADVVILNTCTVTQAADDELRRVVRRVHRENPEAQIIVTGCYAQRAPGELASLPGVQLVVGNSHKAKIVELLKQPFHGEVHVGDMFASGEFTSAPVEDALTDRARPIVKVQDGCSNRCSFCIIPAVRGNSRSASVQQVVNQIRALAVQYPEIVLTGINLGRWGREAGKQARLTDLLRTLLNETDVQRLRLSSVEPMDWSKELLELVAASPRLAKHVHAPLQSGSDSVLRRMRRKYRPRHYVDRIRAAHTLLPDAAIGADVMTGFPGETESEFDETKRLVEELPFTYLHIFPYSERPGTPAADRVQVPLHVRKERGRVLQQIIERKNRDFRARMVRRTLSAVTLLNGTALTSNYLAVDLSAVHPPKRIVDLTIGGLTASGLREAATLQVLS